MNEEIQRQTGVEANFDLSAWVAGANLSAQEGFISALCDAQVQSGLTVQEAADRIGAPVEAVMQALVGDSDLNLTEIRHLAIALDAIVEFRVTNARELLKANGRSLSKEIATTAAWDELPPAEGQSEWDLITVDRFQTSN